MILEQHDGVARQADRSCAAARAGRPHGRAHRLALQRHDERRALADAGAAHLDLAAVQPHQIVHDRQAEPEAAVATRRRAVGLPEAVEHVRQKGGIDADAGIRDLDPDAPVDLRRADRDAAAVRRELDRVRQQIPQHLLQARGVGQHVGVAHVPRRSESAMSLASAAGRTLSSAASSTGTTRQRLQLDLQLAGRHARHVDEVVDQLRLRLRVAIDQLEGVLARPFR